MLKHFLIFFFLLHFTNVFGQRDKLSPQVGHTIYGDSCYVHVKSRITELTNYEFDKHPLEWARDQVENNLLKTDTTYNDTLDRKTVYYYSKQGSLIQIITSSTIEQDKSLRTKIYDIFNNLIYSENLDQNRNTVMRIRRGYTDFSRLLFECLYWETPISRLRIFPESGKEVGYKKPVCDCDF